MMIIKLWPCPHVEVRVHVSEEMIEDLKRCRKTMEETGNGADCSTCSWRDVDLQKKEITLCAEDMLKAIEKKLEDEHGKINT